MSVPVRNQIALGLAFVVLAVITATVALCRPEAGGTPPPAVSDGGTNDAGSAGAPPNGDGARGSGHRPPPIDGPRTDLADGRDADNSTEAGAREASERYEYWWRLGADAVGLFDGRARVARRFSIGESANGVGTLETIEDGRVEFRRPGAVVRNDRTREANRVFPAQPDNPSRGPDQFDAVLDILFEGPFESLQDLLAVLYQHTGVAFFCAHAIAPLNHIIILPHEGLTVAGCLRLLQTHYGLRVFHAPTGGYQLDLVQGERRGRDAVLPDPSLEQEWDYARQHATLNRHGAQLATYEANRERLTVVLRNAPGLYTTGTTAAGCLTTIATGFGFEPTDEATAEHYRTRPLELHIEIGEISNERLLRRDVLRPGDSFLATYDTRRGIFVGPADAIEERRHEIEVEIPRLAEEEDARIDQKKNTPATVNILRTPRCWAIEEIERVFGVAIHVPNEVWYSPDDVTLLGDLSLAQCVARLLSPFPRLRPIYGADTVFVIDPE